MSTDHAEEFCVELPPRPVARGTVAVTAILLGAALATVWAGRSTIVDVAEMHALAATPNTYFVPAHAIRLYVVVPLIAMCAFAAVISPGGLLIIALGAARNGSELPAQA